MQTKLIKYATYPNLKGWKFNLFVFNYQGVLPGIGKNEEAVIDNRNLFKKRFLKYPTNLSRIMSFLTYIYFLPIFILKFV